MYPTRGNIHKIVILRPGALGDVLAVRGTIRLAKRLFPGAEITLAAPGERGRLFLRPGWADHVHDWDRAAFAWLFSTGSDSPPASLRAVFSRADWILSHVDPGDDAAGFEAQLERLAPAAATTFHPPRPRAGETVPVGEWLASGALEFCRAFGLTTPGAESDLDLSVLAASRLEVADPPDADAEDYAIIHPGSGSPAKNWPLENFRELGARILDSGDVGRIVVTSGEADGDLGERLADSLPGAGHIHSPALETLARVLAHAKLYVGNDSGVSHLAAAIRTGTGRRPRVVVIFGPSDPAVWAPPGAAVLRAGEGMDELASREAFAAMERFK